MKVARIQLLDEAQERNLYDEWWCPWYDCPNCKENECTPDFKYCPNCGVKLEWLQPATAERG